MGNGMVIDPWALEKEMGELSARGVALDDNLVISDRAHLILPHHRSLEAMAEEARGARKIGTTLRGIGPAYEDKAGRRGLRMADLLRPSAMPAKLEEARPQLREVCRIRGRKPEVDWDQLVARPQPASASGWAAASRTRRSCSRARSRAGTRSSSKARRPRSSTSITGRIRS
jgi:adenylosuccinate synthase